MHKPINIQSDQKWCRVPEILGALSIHGLILIPLYLMAHSTLVILLSQHVINIREHCNILSWPTLNGCLRPLI